MHPDTDLGHVETAPCHARWANFCHKTKQPTSHLLEDVLLTSLSALPHDGRSTLLRDIAACQKTGQEAADSEGALIRRLKASVQWKRNAPCPWIYI